MEVKYFDNSATTRVKDEVFKEMIPYLSIEYGNPSSLYSIGRSAKRAISEARRRVASLINCSPEEIYFTSCGSESDNTALKGIAYANKEKGNHIITSKIEHPAILNSCKSLENKGFKISYIDVDKDGMLNLEKLESEITDQTTLISIMYANNETGVIYPIQKISEMIKRKNPHTKFFVDAVQVAGKIPIDVQELGVDLLGISGHKFHAPKGVGALYCNSKTIITPLIIGGHQERGKRAGTENVPYIVGLGKAAEVATDFLKYEATEVKRLRDKLEAGILKNVYNARLNTGAALRVPNTTNIGFEYIEGELILLHLSDLGICASSGSACTSGSLEPSHVLRAMNVPFTAIHGSIRLSLSKYTTEQEIDYVNEVLPGIIEKIRNISPYQDELAELKKLKTH